MSGAFGQSASVTALRAYSCAAKMKANWQAITSDTIGVFRVGFNVARVMASNDGRALRTVGGFSAVNTTGGICNLNLALILSSEFFGDSVVFQKTLALPNDATVRQFFSEMVINRYANADTGAILFVSSGIYSLTGIANAEPWYVPIPLPSADQDTLTFRMFAVVNTPAATLQVYSAGPTGKDGDLYTGTTDFLNYAANTPIT